MILLWSSIKVELYKAVHNRWLWMAVLIGSAIASINVLENIQRMYTYGYAASGIGGNYCGLSLFIHWIAVGGTSMGFRILYFVWPILVSMPFGWSYCQERRSGVYDQIVLRRNHMIYFVSKYIAVFVSGGIALALPVFLNLMVNALICPALIPNVNDFLAMVFDGNFLSQIYYTNPWLYSLIWCGMEFLWGGTAACLCFVVGAKPRLQVIVILTPFVILVTLDVFCAVLLNYGQCHLALSPLNLAAGISANQNPEWLMFLEIGVLIAISFLIGRWQVIKHELV